MSFTPEQQAALDGEIAALQDLQRIAAAAMLTAFHDRLRTLAARETCPVCDRDRWAIAPPSNAYVRRTCQICGLEQTFCIKAFGYEYGPIRLQYDRGLAVPYPTWIHTPKDAQLALPEGWRQLDRRDSPQ